MSDSDSFLADAESYRRRADGRAGARVLPAGPDRSEDVGSILHRLNPGGTDLHVFSTLARHPSLFKSWVRFGTALWTGVLSGREREIVILRTAMRTRCYYEWCHHAEVARSRGVDIDEVTMLGHEVLEAGVADDLRLLAEFVDEYVETRDVGDGLWSRLVATYDEPALIELCLLSGQYVMLAGTVRALRIEHEPLQDVDRS